MRRITGALQTECRGCDGLGYTRDTEAAMELREEPTFEWRRRGTDYFTVQRSTTVEVRTIQQGSGCPDCHGTGQE